MLAGNTPTVYLVRHGDTAYNSGHVSPEKFRGHADVPLSAEGKEEGKELGKKLSDKNIVCIYCSDLSRAVDTANMIAEETGADVEKDKDLRPWDLGQLTGKPVQTGIEILNRYASQSPDTAIPEGESFNKFKERYLSALDDILDEALKEKGAIAIIAHSRNLQLTKASNAAPGGLSNHNIDLSVFQDYSKETGTGDYVILSYSKGKWEVENKDA